MSRIVSIGAAVQELFLIDRDDFAEVSLDGQSIFGNLTIGTTADIDKAMFSVGGGGASAAVAFARHGHETIFIGNLAHDGAGEAVVACFDQENIDSSYIEYAKGTTGCSVYLLDARTAARTSLCFQGVARKPKNLNPTDLETIQPDWLYIAPLGGDLKLTRGFFEAANRLGTRIMWAPGAAELRTPSTTLGLLPLVDVLIVNRAEASRLVPGVLLTELMEHLSNYCETIIITDGIMGALAKNATDTFRVGIYEPSDLKDITGVGEAFGAGFLAHFAKTCDFEASLRFAAASASKVSQHYGAIRGLLTGSERLHPMPFVKLTKE